MRRSILTEKIARRGRHIRQEYVVDPMDLMQARDLVTADPATLPGTMTAGDALRYFADEARHRSYPVVDGEGRLRSEEHTTELHSLMRSPYAFSCLKQRTHDDNAND